MYFSLYSLNTTALGSASGQRSAQPPLRPSAPAPLFPEHDEGFPTTAPAPSPGETKNKGVESLLGTAEGLRSSVEVTGRVYSTVSATNICLFGYRSVGCPMQSTLGLQAAGVGRIRFQKLGHAFSALHPPSWQILWTLTTSLYPFGWNSSRQPTASISPPLPV